MRYVAGLSSALHGAALPYGYTITVFASGQTLVREHGNPTLAQVLLFAAGAAMAFGGLRWLSRGARLAASRHLGASRHPIRAGTLHVTAIAAATGSAAGGAELLPELAAWPAGALGATMLYLALVSVELTLMDRDEERSTRPRAPR